MNTKLLNNLQQLYGIDQIEKSLNVEKEGFEKGGKRAQIGEVRTYNGQKWVKHIDGWVHVNETTGKHTLERPGGKRELASDEHILHAKSHLDRHVRESSMVKDPSSSGILTEDQLRERVKQEPMSWKEEYKISSERGLKERQSKIDRHVQAMNDGATEEEADQIANGKRNEGDHSGKVVNFEKDKVYKDHNNEDWRFVGRKGSNGLLKFAKKPEGYVQELSINAAKDIFKQ